MELHIEGEVEFEVEEGVFYNPKMILNRDIGIQVLKALSISEYLDALSASGIRGLRAAKEARVDKVMLNDMSPAACDCIVRNADKNNLTNCDVYCCNANVLLHKRHFQAVDLDPFGSPSPFISAAARSAREFLFITATDTAPLCGAHFQSGVRKYMAVPIRTDYHHEMGARILLGLAARELARLDKGMETILTHATDHYVRTYLKVIKGADAANRTLEEMGYVESCQTCGGFWTRREPKPAGFCSACGSRTYMAGPLWLGRIQDKSLVGRIAPAMEERRARNLLEACASELELPMYYDYHRICDRLGLTPKKAQVLIERLRASGWKASRTHFSGVGIKTDAGIADMEKEMLAAK